MIMDRLTRRPGTRLNCSHFRYLCNHSPLLRFVVESIIKIGKIGEKLKHTYQPNPPHLTLGLVSEKKFNLGRQGF